MNINTKEYYKRSEELNRLFNKSKMDHKKKVKALQLELEQLYTQFEFDLEELKRL